ncbi:MAG: type IV toxin-antitoxin system AbiEi family antitoxin domain-containing protein [Deltaproteobacteria bacterium]|nr:type IV toxin-antitoxin system AbiEi family antitoxin domain-containing protein [Deltaproteobacteria bacterium]
MAKESVITEKVLAIARKHGILRVKDLREQGINPEYLRRLCNRGELTRIARGLYMSADADISANIGLAQAAKWIPHGVVCLVSALQFHNVGTQSPHEIWIAIDRDIRRPRIDYPPLRIMRFSGQAFTEGVEQHKIEGVVVKVFSIAKTVADCFKYRNKIGLDVAIEALRDCRQNKKCTNDELWQYANICRVAKIIKPYMEAIT